MIICHEILSFAPCQPDMELPLCEQGKLYYYYFKWLLFQSWPLVPKADYATTSGKFNHGLRIYKVVMSTNDFLFKSYKMYTNAIYSCIRYMYNFTYVYFNWMDASMLCGNIFLWTIKMHINLVFASILPNAMFYVVFWII